MPTFMAGQILTAAEMNTAAGDSGWINVSGGVGFTNSWATSGGFTVSYRLIGQMVFLRGRISGGTGGATAFTLPSGYQPTVNYTFAVWDNTTPAVRRVQISSGGLGTVTPQTGTVVTCLDGISFPVN